MRFLFLLFLPIFINAQVWVQLPDFPDVKRDDGVAVIVNDVAYFGTGLVEWTSTIDFFALNLKTASWAKINDLPHTTERQYACAFPAQDGFYVTCGDGVGGALNNTYKYTIATNSWSLMAAKPGQGLVGASVFPFGDKVIIVGGKFQNAKLNKEVWEYTISSNTWAQKNDFPFSPLWRASHASLNNSGYLLFGIDSNNVFNKTLYKYNPTNDTWQNVIDFPLVQGRAYANLAGINNRLFVFGGFDTTNTFYNDSWYFRESDLAWIPGPNLPGVARRGGMSCGNATDFYYSCGLSPIGRLTETWKTDVPTNISKETIKDNSEVNYNSQNGMLQVSISSKNKNETFSCEVLSLEGKIVQQNQSVEPYLELNLSEVPAGIYLLKIVKANELTEIRKILKQ